MVERIENVSSEVLVSVKNEEQRELIKRSLPGHEVKFVIDDAQISSPLSGAMSATKRARSNLVLLIASDMPLVNERAIKKLLDEISKETWAEAVVPKWPIGFVEPLHAVYKRGPLLRSVEGALATKPTASLRDVLCKLKVLYVPAESLEAFEETFFNINSLQDLRRVEKALRLSDSLQNLQGRNSPS